MLKEGAGVSKLVPRLSKQTWFVKTCHSSGVKAVLHLNSINISLLLSENPLCLLSRISTINHQMCARNERRFIRGEE
jgi:hypothetical protein